VTTFTPDQRRTLVARYKDGFRAVAEALSGSTDAELDAHPAPGKWSAREIVHHLADSEMTSAIRLRRLLAETDPVMQPYDQDEFARRLHYDRPIDGSVQALRYARETTADIIDRMRPEDWQRAGVHPEHGRYGVDEWLAIYAEHAHTHADQIRVARAAARKA
jgi:hypothetical protein